MNNGSIAYFGEDQAKVTQTSVVSRYRFDCSHGIAESRQDIDGTILWVSIFRQILQITSNRFEKFHFIATFVLCLRYSRQVED